MELWLIVDRMAYLHQQPGITITETKVEFISRWCFTGASAAAAKSSTLPLPHQRPPVVNRERDRERDGYYSDRNELIRERERERERDRGYLSDHNSRYVLTNIWIACELFEISKLTDCHFGKCGEFAAFQHHDVHLVLANRLELNGFVTQTDGVQAVRHSVPALAKAYSVRRVAAATSDRHGTHCHRYDRIAVWMTQAIKVHVRIHWNKGKACVYIVFCLCTYWRYNANLFRGVFDRQDSLRSDYLSDRETRYGIVQQASIDSTDSRLCYLTSSEVCSVLRL